MVIQQIINMQMNIINTQVIQPIKNVIKNFAPNALRAFNLLVMLF